MRLTTLLVAACLVPALSPAQTPPTTQEPDFRLTVQATFDADALAEFNRRLDDYTALRRRLEVGLPPLAVTDNADDIERFEHGLTARIRDFRRTRRSRVFTHRMERQLKRMLKVQVDQATLHSIMDEGPGEFDIDANETYSKERPLATMPVKLLLLLPDLPPEIEYRFVGRHLILRDVRANMIIDEIPFALDCHRCVPAPDADH